MSLRVLLVLAALGANLLGQTRLDLSQQAKSADFSEFSVTRPWKLVSSLPSNCVAGEAAFLTTAVFGQQLHFCSPANAWNMYTTTALHVGDILDLIAQKTAPAELTIGPSCSLGRPCHARFGEKILSFTSPAVVTLGPGTGTGMVFVWVESQGLRVGKSAPGTLLCNGQCMVVNTAMATFPMRSMPIAAVSYTGGVFDEVGGEMDRRAVVSAQNIRAGASANLAVLWNEVSGAAEVDVNNVLDFGGLTATRVLRRGPASLRPSTCQTGDLYQQTGNDAGIYVCTAANQWRGPLATVEDMASVKGRRMQLAQTGSITPVNFLEAGHAPGWYRVCAAVTVTTANTGTLAVGISWRSPAQSASDLTANLVSLDLTATGEGQGCRIVNSVGTSPVSASFSDAGIAQFNFGLTAELLQ